MRVKIVLLGQETISGGLDVSDVGPLVMASQSHLAQTEGSHSKQPGRPRCHTEPQ